MKPMIRFYDIETNETVDRGMSDAEYIEYQKQQVAVATERAAIEQLATDKAAILAKLGITEDELKIALG